MECFYAEHIDSSMNEIYLSLEESKHTKSLRINIDDELLVTNGKGLTAKCKLSKISKEGNLLSIIEFYENFNELNHHITLAIGMIDNNDRFEFIIEKATELGVVEIVPIITHYSSKTKIRHDRMLAKSIAAMKQSKRSVLPDITEPIKLSHIVEKISNFDTVILADENGKNCINVKDKKNILILCGPEGGFSLDEIGEINNNQNVQNIKLSKTRLRTETAAISAISLIVSKLI